MEENKDISNENMESSSTEHKHDRGLKETFKSGSPDEVRDKVKEVVEKGVAAVAGALRGFNEKARDEKVAEQTQGALHQAGETARKTISGVTEEAKNLKEPIREASTKLRETARDVRDSVRSEAESTKSALKDTGSSPYSGIGSTHEGAGAYGTTMGMGGSSLERGGMKENEFPDIRNTPMAESDKKLAGKDLTKDLDDE